MSMLRVSMMGDTRGTQGHTVSTGRLQHVCDQASANRGSRLKAHVSITCSSSLGPCHCARTLSFLSCRAYGKLGLPKSASGSVAGDRQFVDAMSLGARGVAHMTAVILLALHG